MLRFLELNEKKAAKEKFKNNLDVGYSSMEHLANAGLRLNKNVCIVDFDGDNGSKEAYIIEYIKANHHTLTVKTTKGYHFYFSVPEEVKLMNWTDRITVGGIQVDYKTGINSFSVVKLNGVERERNMDLTLADLPELPVFLYPLPIKTRLSGMCQGDGRNDGIFKHLSCVKRNYPKLDIEKIGEFINGNVFAEPLDNELYSTINSVLSNAPTFNETKPKEIKPLEIISALDLQNQELSPIKFIVHDMLPQGLSILCSPPKFGKSWMVLDLCHAVSNGVPFLNHNTKQCGCLYLALEDSKYRLKDRMNKVLNGAKPSPNFRFSIRSESISTGLIEQLEAHLLENPNTELIVIDTLQKIRGNSYKSDSAYGNDYAELGKLKAFADEKEICLLLVHHLRKMGDSGDVFSRISGTNAIMGACDSTLVLTRENRTDEETILSMTGRDIEENELVLRFDKTTFKWQLLGGLEERLEQQKLSEYENDVIVKTIKKLLEQNEDGYEGLVTDIANKCLEEFGESAGESLSAISKKIRTLSTAFYQDGILYTAPPQNKRLHKFTYITNASFNDL